MNGILLVNKPVRMTSHDVISQMRQKIHIKKIGHAGTLDPMATGLLVLLVGNATKVSQYITNQNKTYQGELVLGIETDSYDTEGDIVSRKEVTCSNEEIFHAFESFRGEQYQLPPMFSAKKVNGQPLYKLARKGEVVEREPRKITIFDIKVENIELPKVRFEVACTKGTYIRTLAHDIGQQLGCGAYLSGLCRTQTGNMVLENATPLDDLLAMEIDEIEQKLLPITDILS